METTAKLKNVPTSPRKMRLMADAIRGLDVYQALSILKHSARKESARRLEKLVLSGINNWEQKTELDPEEYELYIKQISVDSGRQLKRFRPAPQGRAHRIRKRSNHVNLVLDSRVAVPVDATAAAADEVDEVEDNEEE